MKLATESFQTYIVKEPVEIETDDYPELEGMSLDEIKNYITDNLDDMAPTSDSFYGSLDEEIMDRDYIKEKTYNNEYSVVF
jgi:hypothetical protein